MTGVEELEKMVYALADYANALESASQTLRDHLQELGPRVKDYDLGQLRWEEREGSSGPYQAATERGNLEPPRYGHWQALVKDLRDHDGKLTKQGYFLWLFQDEKTVGRKKQRY